MKILVLNPGSKTGENVSRDVLYGAWCKGKRVGSQEYPPLPLLSVYTVLKKADFDVLFLDAQGEKLLFPDIVKKFNWKEIDYVFTQTATMTFTDDIELLSLIKAENPELKTIICGSHVTFMPEFSLKNPNIDYVVRFEPEEITVNLLKALKEKTPLKKVKGIAFKDAKEKPIVTEQASFVNLEELPIIDRTPIKHINYYHPFVKKKKWTSLETTRGCPAKCIYCTAPTFFGKVVRSKPVDKIIEELKYLKSLGYGEVFFRDEVLTFHKQRMIELCQKMIDNKLKLKFICNGRADMVDEEMLTIMKKAGCHRIQFGFESGNDTILENIKKGHTVEHARTAIKVSKKVGLRTHVHFMLGCPGETKQTIEDTINLAIQLDPDTVAFNIFSIYPGSDFYEEWKHKLPEKWDGTEMDLDSLHLKSFTSDLYTELKPDEIEKYFMDAYKKFYTRPKYIFRKFLQMSSPREFWTNFKSGLGVLSMIITKKN